MATQESWQTRERILLAFFHLQKALDKYSRVFAELETLKVAVLDDPEKKADLKLLFDQDTEMSMTQLVAKYQKAKTINDWIVENA